MFGQPSAILYHVDEIAAASHKSAAKNRNHQRPRREGIALRLIKIKIQSGGRGLAFLDSTAIRNAANNIHLVENRLSITLSRLGQGFTHKHSTNHGQRQQKPRHFHIILLSFFNFKHKNTYFCIFAAK